MGRDNRRAGEKVRGHRFVALPNILIDSAQYWSVSPFARDLLVILARQYMGQNNGRLRATEKVLRKYGWVSHSRTSKCLKELLAAGLIFRTCAGARPNRASWYAITWWSLDIDKGFDPDFDQSDFKSFVKMPLTAETAVKPPHAPPIRRNHTEVRSNIFPMTGTSGRA